MKIVLDFLLVFFRVNFLSANVQLSGYTGTQFCDRGFYESGPELDHEGVRNSGKVRS